MRLLGAHACTAPLARSGSRHSSTLCKDSINGGPGTGRTTAMARTRTAQTAGLDPRPVCQGPLGRESERSAGLSMAGPAAARRAVQPQRRRTPAKTSTKSTLKIDVSARSDNGVHFVVDLSYAGLFGLRNVPEDALPPFLLIEAPRLLFPFARQIVSDAVSSTRLPAAAARPDRLRRGLHGAGPGRQQQAPGNGEATGPSPTRSLSSARPGDSR